MDPTTGPHAAPGCPLCETRGGVAVWSDADWRAIRVEDEDFPAYYRLVANVHVPEFSDLTPAARQRCMELVCAIERILIEQLQPTKMNLATLGNAVPHLHWHVVARFHWDSRFPRPIWAAPARALERPAASMLGLPLVHVDDKVRVALFAVA